MNVKSSHPLTELLAQLLFSIETVPVVEQRRMVNHACSVAVKWHDDNVYKICSWVESLEAQARGASFVCPECEYNIKAMSQHNENCALDAMVRSMGK